MLQITPLAVNEIFRVLNTGATVKIIICLKLSLLAICYVSDMDC